MSEGDDKFVVDPDDPVGGRRTIRHKELYKQLIDKGWEPPLNETVTVTEPPKGKEEIDREQVEQLLREGPMTERHDSFRPEQKVAGAVAVLIVLGVFLGRIFSEPGTISGRAAVLTLLFAFCLWLFACFVPPWHPRHNPHGTYDDAQRHLRRSRNQPPKDDNEEGS
ncbi:MAG: hypothetical protein QF680_00280 [Acidobacteriota bacterium]|nr:hypothetical protein [Acidobacteriota bacterium]